MPPDSASTATLLTADRGNSTLDLCCWNLGSRGAQPRPPVWRQRLDATAAAPVIASALDRAAEVAGREPSRCVAATVVRDGLDELARVLGERRVPLDVAGIDLPCPFSISYADPSTLGIDRWLGALAALRREPGADLVVTVDCGTAATVNVAERGDPPRFVGGAITAGVQTLARGLALAAPGLPPATLGHAPVLPARSTPDAVTAGVVRGFAGAVDALVEQSIAGAESADVAIAQPFVTGGGAELLIRHTTRRGGYVHVPDLVHEGLCALALAAPRERESGA